MHRLAKEVRVRGPGRPGTGQPWLPGTPPPAPVPEDMPSADIRIGYPRCSHLTQELQSQLDALAAGIPREKTFAEKLSSRVRGRPEFEKAFAACRQIKHEMKAGCCSRSSLRWPRRARAHLLEQCHDWPSQRFVQSLRSRCMILARASAKRGSALVSSWSRWSPKPVSITSTTVAGLFAMTTTLSAR